MPPNPAHSTMPQTRNVSYYHNTGFCGEIRDQPITPVVGDQLEMTPFKFFKYFLIEKLKLLKNGNINLLLFLVFHHESLSQNCYKLFCKDMMLYYFEDLG